MPSSALNHDFGLMKRLKYAASHFNFADSALYQSDRVAKVIDRSNERWLWLVRRREDENPGLRP